MSRAASIAKASPFENSLATLRASYSFRALLPREWNVFRSFQQLACLSKGPQWIFAATLSPCDEPLLADLSTYPLWQSVGHFSLTSHGCPDPLSLSDLSVPALRGIARQLMITPFVSGFISSICSILAAVTDHPSGLFWRNAAVRISQTMRCTEQKQISTYLANGERDCFYQSIITLDHADKSPIMQRCHYGMRFYLDKELGASYPVDRCPTLIL